MPRGPELLTGETLVSMYSLQPPSSERGQGGSRQACLVQEPAVDAASRFRACNPTAVAHAEEPKASHAGPAHLPFSRGDASRRPSSCPKPVTRHAAPHGAALFAQQPSWPPASALTQPPAEFGGTEGREAGVRLPSKQTRGAGAGAWLPLQHPRGSCYVAHHQPPGGGRVSPPLSPRSDVGALHRGTQALPTRLQALHATALWLCRVRSTPASRGWRTGRRVAFCLASFRCSV